MKRNLFGTKPNKQKEAESFKKKMKVIYHFSIQTFNPCEDTRLALKVTFKDGVTDPKIKIVDDHSVSISEVEHCEVVKEESTKFVERYYEVEGEFLHDYVLKIKTNNAETLCIGLPELVKWFYPSKESDFGSFFLILTFLHEYVSYSCSCERA